MTHSSCISQCKSTERSFSIRSKPKILDSNDVENGIYKCGKISSDIYNVIIYEQLVSKYHCRKKKSYKFQV